MGLELYAKIEEMFLDKEAADILWSKFIEILKNLEVKKVLDIGCGGGGFCLLAKEFGFEIKGIDLSKAQIEKAKKRGCDCEAKDLCEVDENYEAGVAIFDVVNYMDKNELKRFFECVKKICEYFVFDINTLYAMEDLAIGTLKAEDENRFSVLYSEFEDDKLITEITLFERDGDCYKKHQEKIVQYYYSVEEIEKISKMKLIEIIPISLYGSEEAEKLILVMKSA
ncbi:methyltransferase domain-containing protein [Caminibacter sp.]